MIDPEIERKRAKQIRRETNGHAVVTTKHDRNCGALYGKDCSCE